MDASALAERLAQLRLPAPPELARQVLNGGLLNIPLVAHIASKGIQVHLIFGRSHPTSCEAHFELAPPLDSLADSAVADLTLPEPIDSVLKYAGILNLEALCMSSILELKLIPAMTAPMLQTIIDTLATRMISLPARPAYDRMGVLMARSIDCLELTPRIERALLDHGVMSLSQLTAWNAAGLLKMGGLGHTSIREIQRRLGSFGLALRA